MYARLGINDIVVVVVVVVIRRENVGLGEDEILLVVVERKWLIEP